jgi:hypothetical protein
MKGILADINTRGPVDALVRAMRAEPWSEFWNELDLALYHFEDFGLTDAASDLEIWQMCQQERLVFITNNRNQDSPDSLEAAMRQHGTLDSLPVFTIADLDKFRKSRAYAARVVERFYEYLLQMDRMRGTGRIFLP